MSLSVVLDACVLYRAALRDTLLRAAEKGLCRAYWSSEILHETTRNLIADGRVSKNQATHLISMMTAAFPEALVDGYEPLVDKMTNDPKDRHVVAAAIHCGAHVIVTSNLDDFPDDALSPHGVEALSPDKFLCGLFHRDSDTMLLILEEQGADLSPPRTVGQVLDVLQSTVPKFVEMVRASA